jgi:catechol 2,3-dioxygenase-like lactoylglutathione lyase family enzyme
MAITGAHAILYTSEPDAVRAVFRDVLGYPNVDAGGGWLIFQLPPAELAMHPTDGAASQELSFMCDDLDATIAELRATGLDVSDASPVASNRQAFVHDPAGNLVELHEAGRA